MIRHQTNNSDGNYNYNAFFYLGDEWYPHIHKNLELVCVLEGELTAAVNEETVVLHPGDWGLVLSYQVHAFTCASDTRYWIMVFSEDFVARFAADTRTAQGKTCVFHPSPAVDTLLREYLMERDSPLMMKKACLYAACAEYLAQVELEPKQVRSDFVVGKVLDYIGEHFTENISLHDCADALQYEYHYLSRLIERRFGIHFRQILNEYRTDMAVQLLMTTDAPMTEIALNSGFQSIRSFNYTVKKLTGKTPGELRR